MKVSYPAALRVSIWLGSFASEDDLEEAITRDVEPRLKLKTDLSRIAESTFSESPSSVRDLLEGFSGWRTFIEQATAAAEKKNLPAVNSAFVCYHLDCSDAPEAWGMRWTPKVGQVGSLSPNLNPTIHVQETSSA